MSARPEILWPLFAEVTSLPGIGARTAKLLERLEIRTLRDLVLTLPQGVTDRRLRPTVRDLLPPAGVTVEVEVLAHRPPRQPGRPWRVEVADAGTRFELVYFHPREEWIRANLP
ncbi:MAG: ATP-dependent DNA helicase RecG, partial [Alphaproteobacteria bacterium]